MDGAHVDVEMDDEMDDASIARTIKTRNGWQCNVIGNYNI